MVDQILIDPKWEWTIDPDAFFSKSRNCPFAGWKLAAKTVLTVVGGDVKYRES